MDASGSVISSRNEATCYAIAGSTPRLSKTLPFPQEVNALIYSHIFSDVYRVIWIPSHAGGPIRAASLNILQVSSTVYREAFDFLYNGSSFRFNTDEVIRVSEDTFVSKVQSARNARLDIHCFPNEGTEYPTLTARINRYIKTLVISPQAHRLELNMNKFAISRIRRWKTFDLFGKFETVEIHALIQTHGYACLTPLAIANDNATTPHWSRVQMDKLLERFESRYGSVRLSERKVEDGSRAAGGIPMDSDFWLVAKVEPKMQGYSPNFHRILKKVRLRQLMTD